MDIHRIMVFCHVLAMIGLFAVLAIEGVSLIGARRATSYEQARDFVALWGLLAPIGMPSMLIVVASGIYLATTLGLWQFGWAQVAVPTLVIIAVAGAIVGPRRNRLRAAVATNAGPLPPGVLMDLGHPLLRASWGLRAMLLLGLVFEMTTKLDAGSFALIGGAALVGTTWALATWRRGRALPAEVRP
jgi:hypothetical protein